MRACAILLVLGVLACSEQAPRDTRRAPEIPLPANMDERCGPPPRLAPQNSGVVNNAIAALDLARLYFKAHFDSLAEEKIRRPTEVRNLRGVWLVNTTMPEGWLGGVLHVEICQSNGQVLQIYGEQ